MHLPGLGSGRPTLKTISSGIRKTGTDKLEDEKNCEEQEQWEVSPYHSLAKNWPTKQAFPHQTDLPPRKRWSYDFVEDRTHNGYSYRMPNLIDEFTHECLAIGTARKLKAIDVICLTSSSSGAFRPLPVRRTGVRRQGRAGMDCA